MVIKLNNFMDKNLQNLYENLILEYQSGFNPPQRIPNQVTPQNADSKISYQKQTIGMVPPMMTSNIYGEQEEDHANIFKIISDIESEYVGDSPTNNAVRLAFSKLKQKLEN
jgi:hypothetical protein